MCFVFRSLGVIVLFVANNGYQNKGRKMELTDKEAEQIKGIYEQFYNGAIAAEKALEDLELLINVTIDECDECGCVHDSENDELTVKGDN
jgi:hypothetical protein